MKMDLEELRLTYEESVRQIEVLDQCLRELSWRQQQAHLYDDETEFHYNQFKLTTMRAVREMYQIYNDHKWKQLQTESSLSLQEILNGTWTDQVASSPSRGSIEEDLHIHMIPTPITPITDLDSLSLTPSRSFGVRRSSYYSSSLVITDLEDELHTRDS